ncbi:MAG: hypothetical protein XD49_1303 [Caldanaerobacter subterraneus]|uniref:Uncharacterized protein n=1 Tax=Caldanaerobacter subterraneus TaxID=911092 RepID=A0A101E3S7_9THEO|nr:hypothetical protein [Caldanaerobacter subterraneus]KUK08660.1 MAG: hypothetical protein XD49_1303 [Caldanaerobacter subterraneus]HBT49965.1 hypothetical protein [Caldanaerobacter subterraneus]
MVKKGLLRDRRGRAGFVFGAFGPGYKSVIRRPLRKIITYGLGAGLIWGAEKKYGRRLSSKLLPFVRGKGRRYLRYAKVALTQLYNYLVSKRKEGEGSEK